MVGDLFVQGMKRKDVQPQPIVDKRTEVRHLGAERRGLVAQQPRVAVLQVRRAAGAQRDDSVAGAGKRRHVLPRNRRRRRRFAQHRKRQAAAGLLHWEDHFHVGGLEHLERGQFQAIDAIRSVDRNHVVILAGAQWNGNFSVFTDFDKDPNMMYECHHYAFNDPVYTGDRVAEFAAFRDKCGKPMYMGETGHNTDDWCRAIREDMERHNIGWTFWPYKMPVKGAWNVFLYPEGWKEIATFAESDRHSYAAFQENVPDRARACALMDQYIENCKFANCRAAAGYLEALGLAVPFAGA